MSHDQLGKNENVLRNTPIAFAELQHAMQYDPEYARGWHDNIACAAIDEGVKREAANRIAARFMYNCFRVRTGMDYAAGGRSLRVRTIGRA